MSKYPCELIEDLIPLYIEDDVSDATREIVEGHLKDCKDCSTLLKDFANDDLNLKDIKEDLPQADTFKKWMRRLKIWG
ncbi:MAG: zf-HC2 domain-containing protein, partial [Bacillota bacterium]|nr:zf-HC2 domain-containing protein [Bacillota bacterium]